MFFKSKGIQLGLIAGVMVTLAMAASSDVDGAHTNALLPAEAEAPKVVATSPEEAGRYLVIVGGCNDCHTPGWGETNGAVPEAQWLIGAPVGFQGPWGTSYPANLRLTAQAMDEEAFVARLKAGQGMPPMPWMNTAQMADADLRAIYRFIRSLGVAGERAPVAVAPGVQPSTPYISFMPVMPETASR